MEAKQVKKIAAVLTLAGGGVAAGSGVALAHGTLVRTQISSVRVQDRIRTNEKPGSQVIIATITVPPGGHTPWHYHPGPHLVSVKTGTVEIYETHCGPPTPYPAGTGFFDPGPTNQPHVHTLRNPSDTETAEIVITDIRNQEDLRPTVIVDPQPPLCFVE